MITNGLLIGISDGVMLLLLLMKNKMFYNLELKKEKWQSIKNIKSNKYSKIIDQIQKVRSKNNKIDIILRLVFYSNAKEASKILRDIYKEDKRISNLAKKLTR